MLPLTLLSMFSEYQPQFIMFSGIFFILPCVDAYARVDLRTRTYDVPPQEVNYYIGINVLINILTYNITILIDRCLVLKKKSFVSNMKSQQFPCGKTFYYVVICRTNRSKLQANVELPLINNYKKLDCCKYEVLMKSFYFFLSRY